MSFLLDTDHISLLEHRGGANYAAFALRLNLHAAEGICVSVISFEEQVLGARDRVLTAKKPEELLRGYEIMANIIDHYKLFPVLHFDAAALSAFNSLRRQKIRISTTDLRIASIALSKDMTVVTRNVSDFGRMTNLKIENWTQ